MFINHAAREITCKLVYYGPGLGGKTTNVQQLHERAEANARGKLVSLQTESERTLFFDFCPLTVGRIRDFTLRFHLYTVPGQLFFRASRALILRCADALVFVADSQEDRLEANIESVHDMWGCLAENGLDLALPIVLQANKRDAPTAMPEFELAAALGLEHIPRCPAIASRGIGVHETFKLASRLVIERLRGYEKPRARSA